MEIVGGTCTGREMLPDRQGAPSSCPAVSLGLPPGPPHKGEIFSGGCGRALGDKWAQKCVQTPHLPPQDTHSVQPRSVPPAKRLQEKQLWSVWTPPVTLWESPVTLWDTSCHPLGIPTASGTHRRLAHGSQEASRPSWLPLYSAQARLLQRKALAGGTEQLGGFLWLLVRPRCHKPPSVPRLGFL